MRPSLSLSICRTLTASSALAVVLLSGCGLGNLDTSAVAGDKVAFSGAVIGGENPVSGATVTFYETKPTGVATNGVYVPSVNLTPLGSTTSDANGNFKFGSALACSSSSNFVYATAAGGNSGTNSSNQSLLLMAAIGSCNGFGSSSTIVMNELTTVAAAYALQGFTSVSGTYAQSTPAAVASFSITGNEATVTMQLGESFTVGQQVTLAGFTTGTYFNGKTYLIDSTPSSSTFTFAITNANVATTPDTTGTVTPVTVVPTVNVTSSTTNYATASATSGALSAAGLAHAFANAANLVNVTTGQVNYSIPSNSGATIPVTMISTLANITQACVNTTGGVATSSSANDGTTCGKLFSYTTTPTGTVPTNTLMALLNIARYPTQNVANIYALGSSFAAFVPSLSTAPTDFSVAIAFTRFNGATNGVGYQYSPAACSAAPYTNGLCYPWAVSLDYNDNVYVLNEASSSQVYTNVLAYTSNGTPLWATPVDTVNSLGGSIAADGAGNVFISNAGTTVGTNANIVEYSAATGAVEQTISSPLPAPYQLAIDASNNVWFGVKTAGAAGVANLIEEVRGTGNTFTQASFGSTVTPNVPNNSAAAQIGYQVAIDPSKNIWLAQYGTTAGSFSDPVVFPYSAPQVGPPAINAYQFSEVNGRVASGLSNYGLTIDSSGNGWITNAAGFFPLVANGSGNGFSITPGNLIPATGTSSLRFLNIDGNNTLWTVDNNGASSTVVGYSTTAATPVVFKLKPCISKDPGPCPTITTTTPGIDGPRITQADSTGSLWVASSTNGEVVQIIGSAAPTWPLIGDIKPGLMP